MTKCFRMVRISEELARDIDVNIKGDFVAHHPEFRSMHLSMDFIIGKMRDLWKKVDYQGDSNGRD